MGGTEGPCFITCYESAPREPWVSRVTIKTSPIKGKARLTATLRSSGTPIGGADINIWRLENNEAKIIRAIPMKPLDGDFDSPAEEAYVDVGLWGWPDGIYMNISAYDANAQRGSALPIGISVMLGYIKFDCEEIRTE